MAGSTLEVGDQGLSESDVAEKLIARRTAQAEPEQPAEEADPELELEQPEGEALEEEQPETDEVEGDLELAAEEQEADDAEPDAEESEAQGTDKFDNVTQLAEATGMELDEFLGSVNVSTRVDGVEGSVTLAQLVKGHQLESSFTRKNQAWIEEKAASETKLESERSKLTDHFALATTAFQLAQEQLMSDFQGVNWDQLQQSNPAEWQVKRQQFGERQARLNQAKDQSTQQIAAAVEKQDAETAVANDAALQREHAVLLEKVPTWNDETVRTKEATEVAEFLQSVGYAESEISELKDHKLILLARAAMGQQGPSKKKLALAKKKVNSVPKLVKPGSSRPQSTGATSVAAKATAKAKRSGDTDDVAQALIARGNARQAKNRPRRRT
jgi:hypothetical protein